MVVAVVLEPSDQKRRRRRARITQADIARRLSISTAAVSVYENGKEDLPYDLTPEDYERELLNAIHDREREGR